MKIKSFTQLLTGLAFGVCTSAIIVQPSDAIGRKFVCEQSNGVPTTFARMEDGKKLPIIHWLSSNGLSPGLTPEKRCIQVSRKFQLNYDHGRLKFIIAGFYNKLPVICAATQLNDACTDDTVLFTILPGSNPEDILFRLSTRRALASGNALNQNASKRRIYIDLDKYLTPTRRP